MYIYQIPVTTRSSRCRRQAALTADSCISSGSDKIRFVDYHSSPRLLYDTRLSIWLPYNPKKKSTGEGVDGEYYFARIDDDYQEKKWKVTYEHDDSSEYLPLSAIMKAMAKIEE